MGLSTVTSPFPAIVYRSIQVLKKKGSSDDIVLFLHASTHRPHPMQRSTFIPIPYRCSLGLYFVPYHALIPPFPVCETGCHPGRISRRNAAENYFAEVASSRFHVTCIFFLHLSGLRHVGIMALPAEILFTVGSSVYPGDLLRSLEAVLSWHLKADLSVLHPFRGIFPGLGIVLSRCFMATCAVKIGVVGKGEHTLDLGMTGLALL